MELRGINIGTIFQGISALLLALGVWWIKTLADRRRAENEGDVIANADAASIRLELRTEYESLNKQNRLDIHDLKDRLAVTMAAQHQSDKQLLEAASVSRQDRSDMASLKFIVRLLLTEIKKLDPRSGVIAQAEAVLLHMEHANDDPNQTVAMNIADHTLSDAKQTVISATAARDEVKAQEAKK